MDLRQHLTRLIAPLDVGDEVLPGVRLTECSDELGLRWSFTWAHEGKLLGDLHVEVEPFDPERRFAARTQRLALSYRTGAKRAPVPQGLGLRLCQAVARIVTRNEASVLAELAREAAAAAASEHSGARIREVEVERLLFRAGQRQEPHYTLSPYVGCLIGCRFCYAQTRVSIARRIAGLTEAPWGSFVDARSNAPEVLRRELAEREPLPIKFCPIVSDPYHAVEKKLRLTRRCLEVIADAASVWPTLVLTRSTGVRDDLELLSSLQQPYLGVSVPTCDDEVRRHFERRGAPIDERLETLRLARKHGVRTFAIVQPLLPCSVEALADALAAAVSSVRIDVLYGVEGAAEEFSDPRYAQAADEGWQRERAGQLAELLRERGVTLWPDELPPELMP